MRAFKDALCETADLAGQHEVIAETLNTSVVQEAHNLMKELKDDRKKVGAIISQSKTYFEM